VKYTNIMFRWQFIRYICYWNIQFLNSVIIIKAKDLLPQA
jgi:hypothetical protein